MLLWKFSKIDDADTEAEYNDDTSSDAGPSPNQRQSNSLDASAPKAYFKLTEYTEMVKIGEDVTLKCEIENESRKFANQSH